MSVQKLPPPSTARVATEMAGAALVDQKLVSQAQLDALLKNPTLSSDEREVAKTLIGHARAALELQGAAKGASKAIDAFASAVDREASAAVRIDAARAALQAGAIDEKLFARLSTDKVSLGGAADLLSRYASAETEVRRLTPIQRGAGDDTRSVLDDKLRKAEQRRDALLPIVETFGGGQALEKLRGEIANQRAVGAGITTGVAVLAALLLSELLGAPQILSFMESVAAVGTSAMMAAVTILFAIGDDGLRPSGKPVEP